MSVGGRTRVAALAPAWHTLLLILVLLAAGLLPASGAPATQASAVLALVVVQVVLSSYVLAGLWLRGHRWRELLGPAAPFDLAVGLGAAAALLALWLLAQHLLAGRLLDATLVALPRTLPQRATWLLVAVVVAGGEEFVFRGYLQRQLEAAGLGFTVAALGQAVVFGVAHANQGTLPAIGVGLCGLALALVARARGGLAAPLVAHFALDACATFWP